LKILLVSTSSSSRGGGEYYLLYLGAALAERGHEATLWLAKHPRMDELAERFTNIGPVIRAEYTNTYDRRARSLASWLDGASVRRVGAEWRTLTPDVIHVNKQNLEDGLDLLAAARLAGLPCVSMIHITQSARYLRARLAGVRDWVARRALREFPGVFVTTPENRQRELADFLGAPERVRMIRNGVPSLAFTDLDPKRAAKRVELGVAESEVLIVAVGRLVPQKRPLLFLQHAAAARTRLPYARFVWVGDGELRDAWDRDVAARGLVGAVQRVGWQEHVAPFLAAADVFLHTAEFEGQPFAMLEAMSAALPCAVVPDLITELPFLNAKNSIVVDDAGTWLAQLAHAPMRTRYGQAARELYEREFTCARMAINYEALYNDVREAANKRPFSQP
jgi:glycosyltransferase involved in cell wall biosynthesis